MSQNDSKQKDCLLNWKPGDSIHIEFDDKTTEDCSKKKLNVMFDKIREVLNLYGVDLNMYGTSLNMRKYIIKRYLREKSDKMIMDEFPEDIRKDG